MSRVPPASVRVTPCGAEAADTVHRLTQSAFRDYDRLDPPSGAGRETRDSVSADLADNGGALAYLRDRPVGCLRLASTRGRLHVRRVAVEPALQGRGIGRALMKWAEGEARRRGYRHLNLGVRLSLPGNIEFYRRLGYEVVSEHAHPGYQGPTWVRMRKRLG